MKTSEIYNSYELINKSKLTKMEDNDKFLIIKASKAFRPIYNEYQEFIKDAQEKLKGDSYEEYVNKYQSMQREHPGLKVADLTPDELSELEKITKYLNDFNKRLADCLNEEAEKEHEVTFDKLSEAAFTKYVASNDFTVEEIVKLQDILVGK